MFNMARFPVGLRPALTVSLVAVAAVALIAGGRSQAADHAEAPLAFSSAELRPLSGQPARGIVHLSTRRTGSQDSVVSILIGLVPADSTRWA